MLFFLSGLFEQGVNIDPQLTYTEYIVIMFFPRIRCNHVFSRIFYQSFFLECVAIMFFFQFSICVAIMFFFFSQNELPIMLIFPRMCCQPYVFPECAANHFFPLNVLPIMFFPRLCCQSCFFSQNVLSVTFFHQNLLPIMFFFQNVLPIMFFPQNLLPIFFFP